MQKKFKVERTKKGYPAMWEKGGGYTNTGEATIIASPEGTPLRPFYIRKRGALANGEHALLPIQEGTVVVEANHHRRDFHIRVWRITSISEQAVAELTNEFSNGEWDVEPPTSLQAAIDAAREKATCYHCRRPHYIVSPREGTKEAKWDFCGKSSAFGSLYDKEQKELAELLRKM